MKNKFKLLAIGGFSAILLIPSFAICQAQDSKKTRHIKMTKIENGKKMEIDTVLTGDNVFIWNGDTINPEKHIKGFSPSEFDKMHPEHMDKAQKERRSHIMRSRAIEDQMTINGDSAEDIQIITDNGDTVGQKIIIHKRLRDGGEKDHFIYLRGGQGEHFPGVPPVPGVPHVRMFKGVQANKGINLNDPNVISFKIKDIGGGREKIEIIRKKTKESENMKIDMDIDEAFQVPEPPMPPMMEGTRDQDSDRRMMKQESDENSKAADKKAQRKADRENK